MEGLQELFRDSEWADVPAGGFQFPPAGFVTRLREIDPFGRHHDFTSTVYVDTGSGFNTTDAVTIPVGGTSKFRLWFDLSAFAGVTRIRWDPVEGRLCRVALERCAWRDGTDQDH